MRRVTGERITRVTQNNASFRVKGEENVTKKFIGSDVLAIVGGLRNRKEKRHAIALEKLKDGFHKKAQKKKRKRRKK